MQTARVAINLLAVAVFAGTGWAQDAPESAKLAALITPYVDGQTLIVAHADLMAFDTADTIDMFAKMMGWPQRQRDRMQADVVPINVLTQTLPHDANVHVFIVSSLLDLTRVPFYMVLPVDKSSPANPIAVEVRRDLEKAWGRPMAFETVAEAVVIGSPETIERLKKLPAKARPEIAAALDAAGDAALRIAFVPPAELRKAFEGFMPKLPAQLGGGATKTLTDGVTWAAVGIDLPPQSMAVRVVMQSASDEAAAALAGELPRLFEALGQMPQVKDSGTDFNEMAKRLLPEAEGSRLTLELTEENGGLEALGPVLLPTLQAIYGSLPAMPGAPKARRESR